jgi:hypothetical protein
MFEFFAEIILSVAGYNVGYFFLKIFSGGKYPKEYLNGDGDIKIEIFGVIMIVVILIIMYLIFI